MREIYILNEKMNTGCDAQKKIWATTCSLDIDDLECGKRSKGISIARRMMFARESQCNARSKKMLRNIEVSISCMY